LTARTRARRDYARTALNGCASHRLYHVDLRERRFERGRTSVVLPATWATVRTGSAVLLADPVASCGRFGDVCYALAPLGRAACVGAGECVAC
jgi:hypothetical protein